MTDLPRLEEGGLGGQFWSVYVPSSLPGHEAVTATLEQIDALFELVRAYPDRLELARTADDVERVAREGRIASMIGVEGGHSIGSSLGTPPRPGAAWGPATSRSPITTTRRGPTRPRATTRTAVSRASARRSSGS